MAPSASASLHTHKLGCFHINEIVEFVVVPLFRFLFFFLWKDPNKSLLFKKKNLSYNCLFWHHHHKLADEFYSQNAGHWYRKLHLTLESTEACTHTHRKTADREYGFIWEVVDICSVLHFIGSLHLWLTLS